MFPIHGRSAQLCDRITRRELMRIGGLSGVGLSLPLLLRGSHATANEKAALGIAPDDKTFGRAKNVIFLWLAGRPAAARDVRPQARRPGRDPRRRSSRSPPTCPASSSASCCRAPPRIADKLAVVRSLSTDDNNHDVQRLLGADRLQVPPGRTRADQADRLALLRLDRQDAQAERRAAAAHVGLAARHDAAERQRHAGRADRRLPRRRVGPRPLRRRPGRAGLSRRRAAPDATCRRCDCAAGDRCCGRSSRTSIAAGRARAGGASQRAATDKFQQQAFDLLTSGKARAAFALAREPDKVRDRYGRNTWGQCCLLARRLVEAGVRLVHVNWPREPGDTAVDNPLWDTHAQNADRLQDVLCPQFDVSFTALIDDLDQPRPAGRDAGRGDRRVRPHAEDQRQRRPRPLGARLQLRPGRRRHPRRPGLRRQRQARRLPGHATASRRGDLTATIFHLLGIDHQGTFPDREGRPHPLTEEQPLFKLLGTEPATDEANARPAATWPACRRSTAACCSTPISPPACR